MDRRRGRRAARSGPAAPGRGTSASFAPVAANRSCEDLRAGSAGSARCRSGTTPAGVSCAYRPSLPPTTSDRSKTVTRVPGRGQPGGGGQPTHPGADDHDPAHAALPPSSTRPLHRRQARPAAAASADGTTAGSARPRTTTDTGWASASGQARPPVARALTTRPATPSRYGRASREPGASAPASRPTTATSGGTAYSSGSSTSDRRRRGRATRTRPTATWCTRRAARPTTPYIRQAASREPSASAIRPPAALDRPGQLDVLQHPVAHRRVPAGPVVAGPVHHQELPAGRGQRRPRRALHRPQRQEGQPRPLQQRLHQPLGRRRHHDPRVRADSSVEPARSSSVPRRPPRPGRAPRRRRRRPARSAAGSAASASCWQACGLPSQPGGGGRPGEQADPGVVAGRPRGPRRRCRRWSRRRAPRSPARVRRAGPAATAGTA